MRTTVELSDRTYNRLRATAAERGMRGFSPIVEEAVERLLDHGAKADLEEWERARKEHGRSNGLGRLAGGWSEEEFREFEEAMAPFERVDQELWR